MSHNLSPAPPTHQAVNDEAVDPLSLAADADPLSSAGGSSSTTKKVVVSVIAGWFFVPNSTKSAREGAPFAPCRARPKS